MHKINVFDDLWPQQGEYLKYIWPTTVPYHADEPRLTEGNEYRVVSVRNVPCADAVRVYDDQGLSQWLPLYQFSFDDQRSEF